MEKIDHKKQGKKNLQAGRRFEVKVRKQLENNGWIVSRWQNNVDLPFSYFDESDYRVDVKGGLVPAKQGIFRKTSTGFPDFIIYQLDTNNIIGVECKSNGKLSKEEKQKIDWLIANKIFNKIIIAKKGEKRGEIDYGGIVKFIK